MVCILFVIGINANDFSLLLLKVLLTASATGGAAATAAVPAFGMTRRVHIPFLVTYFVNMHRAFIVFNHKGIYVVMFSTDCIVTDSLSVFSLLFLIFSPLFLPCVSHMTCLHCMLIHIKPKNGITF